MKKISLPGTFFLSFVLLLVFCAMPSQGAEKAIKDKPKQEQTPQFQNDAARQKFERMERQEAEQPEKVKKMELKATSAADKIDAVRKRPMIIDSDPVKKECGNNDPNCSPLDSEGGQIKTQSAVRVGNTSGAGGAGVLASNTANRTVDTNINIPIPAKINTTPSLSEKIVTRIKTMFSGGDGDSKTTKAFDNAAKKTADEVKKAKAAEATASRLLERAKEVQSKSAIRDKVPPVKKEAASCSGKAGEDDGFNVVYNGFMVGKTRYKQCSRYSQYTQGYRAGSAKGVAACTYQIGFNDGYSVGNQTAKLTAGMNSCWNFAAQYQKGYREGLNRAGQRKQSAAGAIATPQKKKPSGEDIANLLLGTVKQIGDVYQAQADRDAKEKRDYQNWKAGQSGGGGYGGGSGGSFVNNTGGYSGTRSSGGGTVTREQCLAAGGIITKGGTTCHYPSSSGQGSASSGGSGGGDDRAWCAERGGHWGLLDICYDQDNNPLVR